MRERPPSGNAGRLSAKPNRLILVAFAIFAAIMVFAAMLPVILVAIVQDVSVVERWFSWGTYGLAGMVLLFLILTAPSDQASLARFGLRRPVVDALAWVSRRICRCGRDIAAPSQSLTAIWAIRSPELYRRARLMQLSGKQDWHSLSEVDLAAHAAAIAHRANGAAGRVDPEDDCQPDSAAGSLIMRHPPRILPSVRIRA